MLIDEHKAIMKELNSDNIEPARKLELITKLSDDYTATQAEITITKENLSKVETEKKHFAELSQKLWLENSTTLTDLNKNVQKQNNESKIEHQAKRTYQDLMSKF
jgi:cell division septal protein FtsQ